MTKVNAELVISFVDAAPHSLLDASSDEELKLFGKECRVIHG